MLQKSQNERFSQWICDTVYTKNLPQHNIDTTDLCTEHLDLIAAHVVVGGHSLCIGFAYMRSGKGKATVARAVTELGKRCSDPIVLCGDWNAHHSLWRYAKDDARGKALAQVFEDCELAVANDGSPTFF